MKNIRQQIEKAESGGIRNGFNNHLFADGKINDFFMFDNITITEKIETDICSKSSIAEVLG